MRVAFAKRGGRTTVHVPPRAVPIVFVPDVLGTRLTDPASGALAWNPTGSPLGDAPGPFAVDVDRLQQLSTQLVPDETHGYASASEDDAWRSIRHARNVIPDFYGRALRRLADLASPDLQRYGLTTRVYCAGYDWRQDCARSALRLVRVVDEALAETGATRVILVAHGMGGTVARYYCRVLGGERRVQRLVLAGSPVLGMPLAYQTLKRGPPGLYLKDIVDPGDFPDWLEEGAMAGSQGLQAAAALTSGEGLVAAAGSLLGGLYAACCLGAGRFLRRREMIYLARQMPSLYQLLPHALLCRDHPNWALFDPPATGLVPTGFLLELPTLLDLATMATDAVVDLATPQRHFTSRVQEEVDAFLRPENAERTSGITQRNHATLAEVLAEAVRLAESGEPVAAVRLVQRVYARLGRVFLDARDPRAFYTDIYTGLLDSVEMRPLASACLAMAFGLEEALTENHAPDAPRRATDLIADVGRLVAGLFRGAAPAPPEAPPPALPTPEDQRPRAYMHPDAVNIFGDGVPTDAGCVLVARHQFSNNDANLVRASVVPDLLGQLGAVAGGMRPAGSLGRGDGVVPSASASPGDDQLTRPFYRQHRIGGATHATLLEHPACGDALEAAVAGAAEGWWRHETGTEAP